MLKDYGLLLYNKTKDSGEKQEWLFTNIKMRNLARVKPNLYSISSAITVEGEGYFMTLDFDKDILDSILAQLPDYISEQFQQALKGEDNYPMCLDLSQNPGEPISITIRVELGELQQGEDEDFISLIVTDVLNVIY